MRHFNALNMLNTRYIIYNPEAPPLVNKSELGNAWFVGKYLMVNNADEEIKAVNEIQPKNEIVLDKQFQNKLEGFVQDQDSSAKIILTKYEPNDLIYRSKSSLEQIAVFSEIYYNKGWNAYIDGKAAPYFRADFLLRAMRVPAGEHTIEFKFHPKSYYMGEKVSLASSAILILLVLGTFYVEIKKRLKAEKE